MRSAIVITASNRAVAGVYKDLSGGALKIGLENLGYQVLGHKLVQDDMHQIATTIKSAIEDEIDLIVTTGGTGISPTDVTPEATLAVASKTMPGFGEQMRQISLNFVPTAILSRQVAVIRELADRVMVLIAGEKIADGPPAEILRDQRVIDQYLGAAHA